jgi:cystathionine beta-lyase/cystathionine gamma-synthase
MVLDNTWGAGLAFRPFDLLGDGSLGVDVTVHALTKYPSGGGDVLMGSIITRNQPLHMRIKLAHMRLGLGVSGNDAEAVLRSLPSIGLRYHAQDRSARQLAQWLATQSAVAQVCTPPCLTPRAMLAGSSCADKARARMAWLPVCSAWSSTSASTRRPWIASATACACSSWATAGAGL